MLAHKRALGEPREYDELFTCMGKVILAGIESRFPGMRCFLRLKALTKYKHLPDEAMLDNPSALIKLLKEVFGDEIVLEGILIDILGDITKKSREIVRALLSTSEEELYLKLADLYNSILLKSCKNFSEEI